MAADFFVVPTATGRLSFVLVILAHARRRIVHVAVTGHPTAVWTAQQLDGTFPMIVINEAHPRRVVTTYSRYYHRSRTHLGLEKDTPDHRPVSGTLSGAIIAIPEVGGLHHRYERRAA
jgi:hypothetical protein